MYQTILSKYHRWLITQEKLVISTRMIYFRQIKAFLAYLEAFDINRLKDLSQDRLVEFIHYHQHKPYSKTWIRVRVASLQLFFRWAYENKLCYEQPIVLYKKKKIVHKALDENQHIEDQELVILDQQEQKQLYRYLNNIDPNDFLGVRDRSMLTLILASGLYAEEIIALNEIDVYLKRGYVITRQNPNRMRKVKLDVKLCKDSCSQWLSIRKKLLKGYELPFLYFTLQLQPVNKRTLYQVVSKNFNGAGISKMRSGAEVLRQTAICNRLMKGEPIEQIRSNFGINTLSQIERYRKYLGQNKNTVETLFLD